MDEPTNSTNSDRAHTNTSNSGGESTGKSDGQNRRILIAVGAVIALIVAGGIGFYAGEQHVKNQIASAFAEGIDDAFSDDNGDDSFDGEEENVEPAFAKFGETINADESDVKVTVTDASGYGGEYDEPGDYVKVSVTIKNNSDGMLDLTLISEPEIQYGEQGRSAEWYDGSWPSSITPNKTATAEFFYDVPKEQRDDVTVVINTNSHGTMIFTGSI